MNSELGKAEQRSKIGRQEKICCTLCTIKPSDEHGDETEIIVSLQTVLDVCHKYNKSLQIKQYPIIQCMYMRHMGWGPGYNLTDPPLFFLYTREKVKTKLATESRRPTASRRRRVAI